MNDNQQQQYVPGPQQAGNLQQQINMTTSTPVVGAAAFLPAAVSLNNNNNPNITNDLNSLYYNGIMSMSNFAQYPATAPNNQIPSANINDMNNASTLLQQSLLAAQLLIHNGHQFQQQQPLPILMQQQQPLITSDQFMSNHNQSNNIVSSSSVASASQAPPASITTFPQHMIHPPSFSDAGSSQADMITKTVLTPTDTKDTPRPTPTSIIIKDPQNNTPTHAVPEFLCHMYAMVNNPSFSDLIEWKVPYSQADEKLFGVGGGELAAGRVIVHDPDRLQVEVLGRYFRHSSYPSFQRQLNYFGFKKRSFGGKKGKMAPCYFVHTCLGQDSQSLLSLKRRAPSSKNKKIKLLTSGSGATVISMTSAASTRSTPTKLSNCSLGSFKDINKKNDEGVVGVGPSYPSSASVSSPKATCHKVGNNTLWIMNNTNQSAGESSGQSQVVGQGLNGGLMVPTMMIQDPQGPVVWHPPPSDNNSSATTAIVAGTMSGMLPPPPSTNFKTGVPSIDLPDATNDTIIEARKLLEQNFHAAEERLGKNFSQEQQEQQQEQHQQQPPLMPQHQQIVPPPQQQDQQQHPLSVDLSFINTEQQQQLMMMMLQRNHMSAAMMNDDTGKAFVPSAPSTVTDNSWMMGGNNSAVVKPPLPVVNNTSTTAAYASQLSAFTPQVNSFLGIPPSKSPLLNGNFSNVFGLQQGLTNVADPANRVADTLSNNYLMEVAARPAVDNGIHMNAMPSTTAAVATFPITTNPQEGSTMDNNKYPGQAQQQQGVSGEAQQQYLDALINSVLSTTLPPSDELFNEDMSVGDDLSLEELVEPLQVSDDGGINLGL